MLITYANKIKICKNYRIVVNFFQDWTKSVEYNTIAVKHL